MARSTLGNHASTAHKPTLTALAAHKGTWHLRWLGSITALEHPLRYTVDAQFASARQPSRTMVLPIPLGAFPHLALSSVWVDGRLEGVADHAQRTVHFEFGEQGESIRAQSLFDLASRKSYSIFGLKLPAWCRLLTAVDGTQWVLPHSEVLRAWYFFDSQVIPAVVAGAIVNPALLSPRHLPWVPELTYWQGSTPQITHKNRLCIPSAQCLARLLFDPLAKGGANRVAHWIRKGLTKEAITLPPAPLPFAGSVRWTVRYLPITAPDTDQPRYLITQLLESNDTVAYPALQRLTETDLRPGQTLAEDLQTRIRDITRNVFDDAEAAVLTDEGLDEGLLGANLSALAFANSAVNVPTLVPTKDVQTERVIWKEVAQAQVSQVSVDPTADHQDDVPMATHANAPAPERVLQVVHELDIMAVFTLALTAVCQHPDLAGQGWRWDLPFGGRFTTAYHGGRKRGHFRLARLLNEERHLYLIEHEREGGRGYPVAAVELQSRNPITPAFLQQWLRPFPYQGGAWNGARYWGLWVVSITHSPPSLTPEQTTENFRLRLTKALLKLIRGHPAGER